MIEVDENTRQAYEESTTQIDRIILDGQSYRISEVDYDDDCYEDGNIFGTAIARSLEFEIENTVDFEKKEFEYQTGIYIGDEVKWISLGNFIVQDIEPNDTTNINKVIAMDYMLKSNTKYKSKLDYASGKVTMLDVMEEACEQSGLELATKNFINSDFIVDSNQFSAESLNRQVFKAVAQMSGTFAKIRNDNKVHLVIPKRKGLLVKEVTKMTVAELTKLPVSMLADCQNKYTKSSYKELILKRNTHPINLVSLGMSDIEGENITLRDEESISKDGENSLVINDNPFAYTQEKREQLITALFNAVKGFEYTAFEIQGQAKPYTETGDEVVVIDKEGNVCHSFLFRFNYKSPKGLESTMEAPSIIKATVNYQNIPSALDIARRTEIIVNKQEQKITEIVQEQTETSEKLTQHEQTLDSITDTVSKVETKLENDYYTKTEADSQIKQTADSITSSVSKTVTTAKQEAIDSANSSTDNKLKDYTKTVDMNSKITQTAENITSEVNATITEAKQEAIDSANTNTDNKLKDYSTTTQMNSKFEQTAEGFSTEVSKKINDISIGGRNIVLDTASGLSSPETSKFYPVNLEEYHNLRNKEIVISADISLDNVQTAEQGSVIVELSIVHEDETIQWCDLQYSFKDIAETIKTRIFTIIKVEDKPIKQLEHKEAGVYIQGLSSGSVKVDKVKIEVGNKPTGWTPAPEDKVGNNEIISKINQSAEQVQIDANKISLKRKRNKLDWRQCCDKKQ